MLANSCAGSSPTRFSATLANAMKNDWSIFAKDWSTFAKAHVVLPTSCALNALTHRSASLAIAAKSAARDLAAVTFTKAHTVVANSDFWKPYTRRSATPANDTNNNAFN